jgi:2-keto-3-deoxy-L-rhamnonate aldolase RhmA
MEKDRPLIRNPAKERLRRGEPVFGFNVFESLRPSVVKIVAQSGYDILLVENEHIIHNDETLTNFLVMARDNGLSPTATVLVPERPFVSRMLDAGALGICLSHSEDADHVEALARWMKYAPAGERGLALGANCEYVSTDVPRYCREANEATMLLLKIESWRGIENAESMLSNEWVDGVVFGPGDLAASMGFHGVWDHLEVVRAMDSVVDIAIAKGIPTEPSVYPQTREEYLRQREAGIQLFGRMRGTEYELIREGAMKSMAIYR